MLRIAIVWTLILTAAAALGFSGFCLNTGRVMSDDERIRLAVARVVLSQRDVRERLRARDHATYEAYEGDLASEVDAFLARHPGCCRIGPEGGDGYPEPTFWRRISGRIAAIVVVEEGAPDGASSMRRIRQFAVTNCGHVW